MEYFDSLVVFSHAEKLPSIDKPVYGIGFMLGGCDQEEMTNNLHGYIEYLCALQKWVFVDGCTVDDDDINIWIDKEGAVRRLSLKDEFFKGYIADAYAQRPIDYMILYNCNMSFKNDEVTENGFITKNIRGLWKRKY